MGAKTLLPLATVNNKSAQEFKKYCHDLEAVLQTSLGVEYAPKPPKTHRLRLIEKRVFGQHHQSEAAILRFAYVDHSILARLFRPKYQAGDLLAVYPHDDATPRYYSLASSQGDGFIEIAVRRVTGGQVSNYLVGIEIGDDIDAAVVQNPHFHAPKTKAPLILIGAGVGVSPLAGIVRAAKRGAAITLYQGLRDPKDDGLFLDELSDWRTTGQLETWHLAQSRISPFTYVQHLIKRDATIIAQALGQGATVMICGGKAMAAAVEDEFQTLCVQANIDFHALKSQGRFKQDVF